MASRRRYSYAPPTSSGGFLASPPQGNVDFSKMGSFHTRGREMQDAEDKSIDQELIKRAVYGEVGEKPGQSYTERLSEEMKSPARPMTEAETTFRADPYAMNRAKRDATVRIPTRAGGRGSNTLSVEQETERALKYAEDAPLTHNVVVGKNEDGSPIYKSVPITPGEVARNAQKVYKKSNPNDPRWKPVRERFVQPAEPDELDKPEKPSMLDRIKGVTRSAYDRLTTSKPSLKPNETRVFTDGDALPNATKFKEGSYLKKDGKRTHVLRGGKWDAIQ